MRKRTVSQFSLALNILLLLFFIVYFCVPFSPTGVWASVFSPLCTIVSAFQGPDFLPGWCLLRKENNLDNLNKEMNKNINITPEDNINSNADIANPASTKCITDGGQLEIYTAIDGGQKGLCIFSDQSICEEWIYFRGECKKGECQKVCKAINTNNEGWYNSCTGELIKKEICSVLPNNGNNLNVNSDNYDNATPSNLNTNTNTNSANIKPISSSAITVNSPVIDEQLSSPVTVSGRAKTPDNKIYVRVKSKAGQAIINVEGSVKNIGVDGYGDFSLKFNYEFSTTKEGFIEVFGKDGETEIGLVSIPVKF